LGPPTPATRVASVEADDGPLEEAPASLSVTVRLDDELDVSRRDLIAAADGAPEVARELLATVCWFADTALRAGDRYRLKHTSRVTPALVGAVEARLDPRSLDFEPAGELGRNDIGVARLVVGTPLAADPCRANRVTGSCVLIDEHSQATVAAGTAGPPLLAPVEPG